MRKENKINTSELVKNLQDRLEVSGISLSRRKCSRIVEELIEELIEDLERGNEVMLNGLGKFIVKERYQRYGVNPQTLKKELIPGRLVGKFRGGHRLKRRLNNKVAKVVDE